MSVGSSPISITSRVLKLVRFPVLGIVFYFVKHVFSPIKKMLVMNKAHKALFKVIVAFCFGSLAS